MAQSQKDILRTPCAINVKILFAVLTLLLMMSAAFSVSIGSGNVGLTDVFAYLCGTSKSETANLIISQIRLPRLAIALISGASLALAGAGMQSIFRNPLADPSITGVSSGAAFGAVIGLSIFGSQFAVEICALLAGLCAALFVCLSGRIGGKISILSTLLGGIAINAFCGAVVGFFMYSVHDASLRGFVFWTLGSLDKCNWSEIISSLVISLPAWILIFALSPALNVMLLGHNQARNVGVNTSFVWAATLAAASIMTAASVAVCGMIGFIGLIVPHIIRMATSANNKTLMPLSALAGALVLVWADIAARLFSPSDPIPIGVITALLGAPFFLLLLRKKGEINND